MRSGNLSESKREPNMWEERQNELENSHGWAKFDAYHASIMNSLKTVCNPQSKYWGGVDYLMERTKITRCTITRKMADLEKWGYLILIERGLGSHNKYEVHFDGKGIRYVDSRTDKMVRTKRAPKRKKKSQKAITAVAESDNRCVPEQQPLLTNNLTGNVHDGIISNEKIEPTATPPSLPPDVNDDFQEDVPLSGAELDDWQFNHSGVLDKSSGYRSLQQHTRRPQGEMVSLVDQVTIGTCKECGKRNVMLGRDTGICSKCFSLRVAAESRGNKVMSIV